MIDRAMTSEATVACIKELHKNFGTALTAHDPGVGRVAEGE